MYAMLQYSNTMVETTKFTNGTFHELVLLMGVSQRERFMNSREYIKILRERKFRKSKTAVA